MDYLSKSEKETYRIASMAVKEAKAGDVFALYGDLGSGKTTFVKGLAKSLGVRRNITSPTFVILKEYPVKKDNIQFLIHTDCYRFKNANDVDSTGLLEYFDRSDCITVIEWPEKIEEILPKRSKKIHFEYIDVKTRKISFNF